MFSIPCEATLCLMLWMKLFSLPKNGKITAVRSICVYHIGNKAQWAMSLPREFSTFQLRPCPFRTPNPRAPWVINPPSPPGGRPTSTDLPHRMSHFSFPVRCTSHRNMHPPLLYNQPFRSQLVNSQKKPNNTVVRMAFCSFIMQGEAGNRPYYKQWKTERHFNRSIWNGILKALVTDPLS